MHRERGARACRRGFKVNPRSLVKMIAVLYALVEMITKLLYALSVIVWKLGIIINTPWSIHLLQRRGN